MTVISASTTTALADTHGTLLVFPGQGVQHVGMGLHAHKVSQEARRLFALADEALDFPLSRLCFEGSAEDLLATRWQQPAILTCSLAILAAWEEQGGVDADTRETMCVAGHSLGEYSAYVYAGALSFVEAVRLTHVRAMLMQEAAEQHPGGMMAVLGLEVDELSAICAETEREFGMDECVVVANRNSAQQIVLSGTSRSLEHARTRALARGARRVLPLAVAGAFHSPAMVKAAEGLAEALRTITIADARIPVLANSTGQPIQEATDLRRELERQMTAPVLWTETMLTAVSMGTTRCVDSGPGEILLGLAKRTAPTLALFGLERAIEAIPLLPNVVVS